MWSQLFSEISGDEQQGARRSPAGSSRKPSLVWQGEILYRHCRDSSMVEEGGQLDRRVVFGPRDDVLWRRRFKGESTAAEDYVQQK